MVTFLLPLVIGLLLYLSAFMLYIYKLHWGRLRSALIAADKWETARKFVAIIWDAHGWIWHGNVSYLIKLICNCEVQLISTIIVTPQVQHLDKYLQIG